MDVYLSRIPFALANLDKLLQSRGYEGHPLANTPTVDLLKLCLKKKESLGGLLSVTVSKKLDPDQKLRIGWIDPVFDMAKGREVMTSGYQLHGASAKGMKTIIVSYAKMSPDALKESLTLKDVQIMTFAQLAIQLDTHMLVPKHVALTDEEAEKFETVRKMSRSQLPIMKETDPISLWYGLKRGTIVRIERPQGFYWRVVN
jgi:DNA-directed RNA polymerase subunit H (RpoH/RPB5)